jgi:HrpA-like RNA helicase
VSLAQVLAILSRALTGNCWGQGEGEGGAILIFMPGAPEIGRLVRQLERSGPLTNAAAGDRLRILPLHGALSPNQQVRQLQG